MNNKLQAKDLINLGLFTVLYFVLGCCVAIPIGFVPIFLPFYILLPYISIFSQSLSVTDLVKRVFISCTPTGHFLLSSSTAAHRLYIFLFLDIL